MASEEPITDDEIRARFAPMLGAPIAVAVSGGADSMALMHLAQRALALVPPPDQPAHSDRPRLLVLTVDHGLRPDSADDADWVADQAEDVGLPCKVLKWGGRKPSKGIQAAARAARYRLLHEALVEEAKPYDSHERWLLTAHHQEDQAETFVMRLARGSGIDGLSAMQEMTTLSPAPTPDAATSGRMTIRRPLLDVPKSRLIATLEAAGLSWREDPSNEREDFERVRIRKALAILADVGVTSDAIARSAARLSRARRAIERQTAEAVAGSVEWHDGVFGSVALAVLAGLPEEITIRVLSRLIDAFGGDAPAAQLSEIEALAERVLATTERTWPARAATLGGCRLDWRPGGALRVWREAGRTGLPPLRLRPGTRSATWDRRFAITASPDMPGPVEIRALGVAGWRTLAAEHPDLTRLRLPPGAAATLPACWSGERLMAVPGLPAPQSAEIRAEFVAGRDHTEL